MMGIDDGGGIKDCVDEPVGFEGEDDYCICGDTSKKIVPGDIPDSKCNELCGAKGLVCMIGIDDGKDIRECTKNVGFEAGAFAGGSTVNAAYFINSNTATCGAGVVAGTASDVCLYRGAAGVWYIQNPGA